MSAPTWEGWPEVYAAQEADIRNEPDAVLYPFPWNDDDRYWIPDVLDSGITWLWGADNEIYEHDMDFYLESIHMTPVPYDLWNEVEDAQGGNYIWRPVIYPN